MGHLITIMLITCVGGADVVADARTFLDHCRAGRFQEARGNFNAKMVEALSTEKLDSLWKALGTQLGPIRAMGEPSEDVVGQSRRVRIRCDFQSTSLDALISFDPDGKIEGFFLVPVVAAVKPVEPPYVDVSRFTEEDVQVGAEGWPLAGTLTRPKSASPEPVPLVILVHGSGPQDRDESIGPNTPFRDLAHGLACRGLAVLRFEKRTFAHKERYADVETHRNVVVQEEVIDDALAAVQKARSLEGVDADRIVLLGHSLGGAAAPEIARQDGRLAGTILLAASSRPIGVMVREQVAHIRKVDPDAAKGLDALDAELDARIDRLEAGEAQDDETILGATIRYWKSVDALDSIKTLVNLPELPVLIIQGGRDYQVTEADFNAYRHALEGRPNVEFRLFSDLNHIFVKGEGIATPADYQKPGFVDVRVVDSIADWIEALPRR